MQRSFAALVLLNNNASSFFRFQIYPGLNNESFKPTVKENWKHNDGPLSASKARKFPHTLWWRMEPKRTQGSRERGLGCARFTKKFFSLISEIKWNWICFTCVSLFHYKISLLFFRFFSLLFASNFSLCFTLVIFISKWKKAKQNSSLFFRFFSLFFTFFHFFSLFSALPSFTILNKK